MQTALIVNIYKRATASSSIKHPSFNNIMHEGEVHYAMWELKIRMYLSSNYMKFCTLAFMSGFTEAVTILKSVNDLAQKIILWNDSAALLPQKNGFLSRYKYSQIGKNVFCLTSHTRSATVRNSLFLHQQDQTYFSPFLSNSSFFKNVYQPSVITSIVIPDEFQVTRLEK